MTNKPRAADPDTTGSAPGGSEPGGTAEDTAAERVVIRDNRKVSLTGDQDGSGRDADADTAPSGGTGPGGAEPTSGADDDAGSLGDVESTSGDLPGEEAAEPAEVTAETEAGAEVDEAPDGPVVDDAELAEVLEAEKPSGTDGPVVDAPAKPVSGSPDADGPSPFGAELEALRADLEERTRDLQRVSAEYANYRKRVDRDRGVVAEQTTGTVLAALLPVLDDLDRAREHGDLVGPFGTVAEQLTTALGKFGLTGFGEKGDPFDPTRHEAVAHQTSTEVTEPTCVDVMRRGYLLGDRMLRPALVAVADPE